jgi:hypothetical protein
VFIDLFLIGLVVTLEPVPITGMILLLAAERGALKGLGYVLGWLATIAAIIAATVVITGGEPLIPKSAPSTASYVVKLVIGIGLILIGYRHHGKSKAKGPPKQPKWMSAVDRVSPLTAAGLGFLLQPWPLVCAGVATITQAQITNGHEFLALALFTVLCTASLLTMEIYAVLRPAEVKATLARLLGWINRHRDQAIVYLSIGIGLYLVARSIYSLVST